MSHSIGQDQHVWEVGYQQNKCSSFDKNKLFVKVLPSKFKLIYPPVENATNWNLSAFLHTRKVCF